MFSKGFFIVPNEVFFLSFFYGSVYLFNVVSNMVALFKLIITVFVVKEIAHRFFLTRFPD